MSRSRPAPANADEEDVFSRYWRHRLCCLDRAGVCKRTKRRANRRARRVVRVRLRSGDELL